MKTAKEVASELKVNYYDLIGFLRLLGFKKIMGVWRLNDKEIENIKLLLNNPL